MNKHKLEASGLRGEADILWLFLDLGKNSHLAGTRKLLWAHPLPLSMPAMDICEGPWFNLLGSSSGLSSNNQADDKCMLSQSIS